MSTIAKQHEPSTREVTYTPPKGIIDLDKVSLSLIEMMDEVKKNPQAIPQAECMAGVASRICEIAKTQVAQGNMVIEMMRLKNS